jgi:hypothetical protein
LYTCIFPPFTIHAQLEVVSLDGYTILHLRIRFHSTITVRTPVITNVLFAHVSIVRFPFLIARIFGLPLSAGISSSLETERLPSVAPLIDISAILVLVLVVAFVLVVALVVVLLLIVPIPNPARMLCGVVLTNDSILRLTGVPVVPTRALDTRTGRLASPIPDSGNVRAMFDLHVVIHWNALLSVGPIFPAGVLY